MSTATNQHRRRPSTRGVWFSAVSVAALAATLLAFGTAGAQSPPTSTTTPHAEATAANSSPGDGPDLQGLWDFTMRVGDRTSTGFFALGPVDGKWAGSLTPDSTNTLAIRVFAVHGDSVTMIVASREGDVPFHARLTNDGHTMEGIVVYHGGARLPMTATRRARRSALGASRRDESSRATGNVVRHP